MNTPLSLYYWYSGADQPNQPLTALIAVKVDDGTDDGPRWEIKKGLYDWRPAHKCWRGAISKEKLDEHDFMWLPAASMLASESVPLVLPAVPADADHEAWFSGLAGNIPLLHNITRRQSRFIWLAARAQPKPPASSG